VTKAYAFFEDGTHAIVTRAFLECDPGRAWERRVSEAATSPVTRVEVRSCFRGQKHRTVLRPGATYDPDWHVERCRGPRILRAVLVPREGSGATPMDVTDRVSRYAGQDREFGGVREVADMFPFDDNEDNAARFAGVSVIDGALRWKHMAYDDSGRR
jgi:hypothetical protein